MRPGDGRQSWEGFRMSSVVGLEDDGAQLELDRSCWFSTEACRLLERAVDEPKIGPEKTLAVILHKGLGLPLSLVGRLMGTNKNVVAKQVISAANGLRKLSEANPVIRDLIVPSQPARAKGGVPVAKTDRAATLEMYRKRPL